MSMVSGRELQKLRKQGLDIKRIDPIWVEGQYKRLKFQAQIFDAPSKYGIKKGRTSRLRITKPYANATDVLASFERGWEKKPKTKAAKTLTRILSMTPLKPQKRRK